MINHTEEALVLALASFQVVSIQGWGYKFRRTSQALTPHPLPNFSTLVPQATFQRMPPRLPGNQTASDGRFRSASEDVSVGFPVQSGEKRKRGQPKKYVHATLGEFPWLIVVRRQGACVHCKSLKVGVSISVT